MRPPSNDPRRGAGDELDGAEAVALGATLATAKALVSLLELVSPIIERRSDDVRFGLLHQQVRLALLPGGGTPVTLRALLAELGERR